jgi:hypothetical protein
MAWYYWLYIALAILWFLDLYSTLIRATPQNAFADLVVKPIFVAVLAAIWPISFMYLFFKRLGKATQ